MKRDKKIVSVSLRTENSRVSRKMKKIVMRRIPAATELWRKRTIVGACGLVVLYFLVMDIRLYYRVRDYRIREWTDESDYEPKPDCDLDPLCKVTVKGLMLDYPNFYIFGPLAALVNRLTGLSSCQWITPTGISVSHVFVAVAAAKCISSKSLRRRRLGVLLFQVRSWLDDLDGFVARKRRNIDGERSEVGSVGYYVDAVCDALGMSALLLGVFQYLRTNLSKPEYEKLQMILPTDQKASGACVAYRKKLHGENVILSMIFLGGSLLASSLTWNRYIKVFSELLESDFPQGFSTHAAQLYSKQTEISRLNSFLFISLLWRLTNPHALADFLLIAIFVDRTWSYIDKAKWISYGSVIISAYLSEFYYHESFLYVMDSAFNTDTNESLNIVVQTDTQF